MDVAVNKVVDNYRIDQSQLETLAHPAAAKLHHRLAAPAGEPGV